MMRVDIQSVNVHVRNMGYQALIFMIEQIDGADFLQCLEKATKRLVMSDAQFKVYIKSKNLIERMFTETNNTVQRANVMCTGDDSGDYTVHFWNEKNERQQFQMYNGACYFQAVAVAFIIGKTGKEVHEIPEQVHI